MLRQRPILLLEILKIHHSPILESMMCTSFLRGRHSKVPQHPVDPEINNQELPSETKIDIELVQHLEKLSLVDFANNEGLLRLQAAISLADKLSLVNTEGVEPLYSILEDRSMALADDEVLIDNTSDDILGCAKKTLEDYFVVPPGNIDYKPEEQYYDKLKEKEDNS